MSQELIDAAFRGDLDEVKSLLSSPNPADIDFIGTYPPYHSSSTTALVAAIESEKWDMTRFLLEQGAMVAKIDCYHFELGNTYESALIVSCTRRNVPADILRSIIARAPVLNPSFTGAKSIIHYHATWEIPLVFSYFFKEAILRDDRGVLSKIMKDHLTRKVHEYLSFESFAEYLENREVTPEQVQNANKAIAMLVEKNYLCEQDAQKLKVLLRDCSKLELSFDDFPPALLLPLKHLSNRSLEDLFCKLQHLLYPDLNLPEVSLDAKRYQRISNQKGVLTETEIRTYQNPVQLRKLLEQNQARILKLLSLSFDEASNLLPQSVQLLAGLIFYYHDERIVNKKIEPLLNAKQQKAGVKAIHAFCALTPLEQATLKQDINNQKKFSAIETLIQENSQLKNEVQKLRQDCAQLQDSVQTLEEKFNKLLADSSDQAEVQHRKDSLTFLGR